MGDGAAGRLRQTGYNYQPFGFKEGEMDTGTMGFAAAMNKLKTGNCDVVLALQEIVVGIRAVGGGDYFNSPDFGFKKAPGVSGITYHMMVSRKLPYSTELLNAINQGISEKTSDELRKKYLQ